MSSFFDSLPSLGFVSNFSKASWISLRVYGMATSATATALWLRLTAPQIGSATRGARSTPPGFARRCGVNAHSIGRHARHRRCKRSTTAPRRGEDSSDASSSDEDEPETAVVVYDPASWWLPRRPPRRRPRCLPPADGAGPSTSRATTPELEHAAAQFCRRPLLPQQAVVERGGGGRSHRAVVAAAAGHAGDRAARGAPIPQLKALAQAVGERVGAGWTVAACSARRASTPTESRGGGRSGATRPRRRARQADRLSVRRARVAPRRRGGAAARRARDPPRRGV